MVAQVVVPLQMTDVILIQKFTGNRYIIIYMF